MVPRSSNDRPRTAQNAGTGDEFGVARTGDDDEGVGVLRISEDELVRLLLGDGEGVELGHMGATGAPASGGKQVLSDKTILLL